MTRRQYLAVFFVSFVLVAEAAYIRYQHKIISDLIDLNHDKSLYIDSGCRGRFEGSEEEISH